MQNPLEVECEGEGVLSPAEKFERDAARHVLDDLFRNAHRYASTPAYRELMDFVARFRFYSPFNAMLIHIQMKGATFVAPADRWVSEYRHRIKPDARPLVILRPMGPVMFVFDVADTEALPDAPPLPREVERPFEVYGGTIGDELKTTTENAIRDGIRVTERPAGSQSAGSMRAATEKNVLSFQTKRKPAPEYASISLRYELLLNSSMSAEARYATLVHELAHLYCGHLGTPNKRWWPDRLGLADRAREFEAESVCHLVCKRLSIDNPSDEYLAGYLDDNKEVPAISLDCVMKAAGLIERMGREHLGARRDSEYQNRAISDLASNAT